MTSSLRKQVLTRPGGALPPIPDTGPLQTHSRSRQPRDYSPLPWSDFFTEKKTIDISGNSFCIYTAGQSGPLFVLLHGGGYSGLTWSCFTQELIRILECRVLAIDLRGHGDTKTTNDTDLSIGTLANDVNSVIEHYIDQLEQSDQSTNGVIIVGHSMGGAIAVHTAALLDPALLLGCIVIDVVEGTALDALFSMQSFLRGRPSHFKSLEQGIEWCLRSGQTRNLTAARVSFPTQLMQVPATPVSGAGTCERTQPAIPENGADEETGGTTPPEPTARTEYTWRIDLTKTEQFWKGWFEGLSNKFLDVPAPKTLILAGVDRLDRDLTVGQMQGKFQMIVLPKVGHAVHEDSPTRVAEALATFSVRHKLTVAKEEFKMVFPGC